MAYTVCHAEDPRTSYILKETSNGEMEFNFLYFIQFCIKLQPNLAY